LKDERLKEDRILKGIKALIKSLKQDIKEADKKIVAIDNDILTIDARLIAIANDQGIISANIPNLEAELKILADNYEQNKIDTAEVKRQNKLIAKRYEEAFK
jgi:hypothetical protein